MMEQILRNKKWIWIAAIVTAVATIAGVVVGIFLPETGGLAGDRPDIYWNVDRAEYIGEMGFSTRQAGEDGKWHITFAHNGKQEVLTVSDKRLVNAIDSADAMGLEFDENGEIADMVNVTTFAKEIAKNFYVVKVEDNALTLSERITLDGFSKEITCTIATGVYAMTDLEAYKGHTTKLSKLKPLDVVTVYGNNLGEITHVAVMSHPVESAIYYRVDLDYQYDSATEQSTRVPNSEGIYEVDFAANGEIVTLKIKDPAVMAAIDKPTADQCHFGFIFDEEGFVIGTQPAYIGIRGRLAADQYDVIEVNSDYFIAQKVVGNGVDVGAVYTNTLTENTVIYECSTGYFPKERGKQVESLQVGDRIVVFENTVGQTVQILITNRLVPGPMYFNIDVSGRLAPNAEGWYALKLFNGETVDTYRTKDRDMAMAASEEALKGLTLYGDVIVNAYPAQRVCGNDSADHGRYHYTVTGVNGAVITMQSSDSDTVTISRSLSADCRIYNMSSVGQAIGAKTQLKVGDRVISAQNACGEFSWVYVIGRISKEEGKKPNVGADSDSDAGSHETPVDIAQAANKMTFPADGSETTQQCPACGKNVTWYSLRTVDTDQALIGGKHYYLHENLTGTKTLAAYDGAACIHLNGKTLTSTAEAVLGGWSNNALTVMGNGYVVGSGVSAIHASMENAVINIYGGEFSSTSAYVADVSGANAALNFYSGKIADSAAVSVAVNNSGSFNMYGGEVSGKFIACLSDAGAITVNGGKVTGQGISVNDGKINITGGEISQLAGTVNADEIKISGDPVIALAKLDIFEKDKVIIGQMSEGASVTVRANGVFTADFETVDAAKDAAQYFFANDDAMEVTVAGMALAVTVKSGSTSEPEPEKPYTIGQVAAVAEKMRFSGTGMQTGYCPKCNKDVSWTEITADSDYLIGSLEGEHYYLAQDVRRATTLFAFKGDACIFFNGYTLTYDASAQGHAANPAIGSNGGKVVTLMGSGGIVSTQKACAVPNGGVLNICGGEYTCLGEQDVTFRTNNAASVLNIYAGTIHGTVRHDATLTNAQVNISGKVTIETLELSAAVVGVGTLTEGAKIAVKASGVFTEAFADEDAAQAAKSFFTAADDTMEITVDGAALSCVAKTGA